MRVLTVTAGVRHVGGMAAALTTLHSLLEPWSGQAYIWLQFLRQ